MLEIIIMMTMNYDQEWSDQRHAGDADSAGVRRHYHHLLLSFIVSYKSHHI